MNLQLTDIEWNRRHRMYDEQKSRQLVESAFAGDAWTRVAREEERQMDDRARLALWDADLWEREIAVRQAERRAGLTVTLACIFGGTGVICWLAVLLSEAWR